MENKKLENTITKRTEEVQDIINRMPQRVGIFVFLGLLFFVSLMLLFGFTIKYPETVSGIATMRAQHSPVRLTSPVSGRLCLLTENKKEVINEEMIAYIENSANIKAFFILDSLMRFDVYELRDINITGFKDLVLGELTVPFLKLINSIEVFGLYAKSNPYAPKIKQLEIKKENNKQLREILNNQILVQTESVEIQKVNLYKDSIQYFQLSSITEVAYMQGKASYMNALQGMNGLLKERQQLNDAYKEILEQINQLQIEQAEHEQSLTMNLFFTHEELKSQIAQWKQKYAFVSPYKGNVEMLGFWKDKSFVHLGEEIFAIIPNENPLMAQVVIPSAGAGKVKAGMEVIVKLDDFPYLEYGAIKGKVSGVSMLGSTSSELVANQKLLAYQVDVELPEQLKTNYGSVLSFKHDMKGHAQIQVKKRKLIERLFDNLKYIMNE